MQRFLAATRQLEYILCISILAKSDLTPRDVLIDRLLSERRRSVENINSFLNVPSIMYLKDTLFSVSSVWTRVNSPWG